MKTLGVVANVTKDRAKDVLARLETKALAAGLTLLPDADTAALMGRRGPGAGPAFPDQAEAVMVLGGDGTMLRAVRALAGRDLPVIGVNLGALGFMTSVTEGDLERAVDCIARDQVTFSRRVVLQAKVVTAASGEAHYRALNDVVVNTIHSRVVTLRMHVNGQEVGDFVCDGLIISSPTGSTGHSLSAGGPVLMPEASAFVVSLICPHTLSTRPLVLPDDVTIDIVVTRSPGNLFVTADGQQEQLLAQGDRVTVRRDERGVRFMHLPGYSYFGVLRQKLHWRGSNV